MNGYAMYGHAVIWLIWAVVFLAVEGTTVTLISVWFAAGALAAMIAALCGGGITLQIVLFMLVSCALLALLRPFVRKYVKPRIVPTNVDSLAGTEGIVTEQIDNLHGSGQIKLGGMTWSARSAGGECIPEGTLIRVDRVEGVKAIVSPAEASAVL